jgi:sensor histidine kinase YesM
MVVLLLWSNRYLKRHIAAPLLQLVEGTRQIAGGNIHHRVPVDDATASAEFLSLIRAFNDMTSEIETLKIATYEERLERQTLELNALRLRLRPHFYLNAISTISSLSMRGSNHDIQKFVAALSEYLRYLFSDERVAATVQTEFAHAAAFVRLHQIRSPGLIFYYYEIDEGIHDVPVPKLMVQTFVENIFKHAFSGEKMISVFFKAMPQRRDDMDYVYLMVEDTGCGFPPAILQGGFSEGSVGIQNIAQTLRMQYDREDLLCLSNSRQGGALVEIWIPRNSGKEDSHDAFNR